MELESEWPTVWGGLLRAPTLRTDSQITLLKTVFSKKKSQNFECVLHGSLSLYFIFGALETVS